MSSEMPGRPRVIVADDDDALRYAISLIAAQQCEVVGEASDGAAAVRLAAELRPDVVLLDISMPVMNGLEAVRRIREQMPEVRVIILSNYTSAAYREEAFRTGAHGYVVKGSAILHLPAVIQDALDGKVSLPE